jgi:hypothetical protein
MSQIGKRLYERIKTGNMVIEFTGYDGRVLASAEAINISPGGMCFLRSSMFTVGDILKIAFPLNEGKMYIEGKVLRISGREVGIKFTSSEENVIGLLLALNNEFPTLNIKSRLSLTVPTEQYDDRGIEKALQLDDFNN